MSRAPFGKLASACLALALLDFAGLAMAAPPRTALDDYIARPDPAYTWKLLRTIPGDGVTTFVVDMTSQTWRSTPQVDRPRWQHWVVVVKPNEVKHETALLW